MPQQVELTNSTGEDSALGQRGGGHDWAISNSCLWEGQLGSFGCAILCQLFISDMAAALPSIAVAQGYPCHYVVIHPFRAPRPLIALRIILFICCFTKSLVRCNWPCWSCSCAYRGSWPSTECLPAIDRRVVTSLATPLRCLGHAMVMLHNSNVSEKL